MFQDAARPAHSDWERAENRGAPRHGGSHDDAVHASAANWHTGRKGKYWRH
jgi:hypothetical protein